MGAFADADPGGADEQESIAGQVVGSAQFLLQALILLRLERSGQITRLRREVFATNEIGPKGMAVGGQIVQQPPETDGVVGAGFVTQRRLLFAQPAEPAEEIGITAELGGLANLWESRAEVSEKVARGTSIMDYRTSPHGQGERLQMRFKDPFEAGSEWIHERWEASSPFRFWRARVYSRQTSWGASWT